MNLNRFSKLFFSAFISGLFLLVACKPDGTIDPGDDPNPSNISVEKISTIPVGDSHTVSGNLRDGELLDDLDWADLSNVACFPGTRFIEFEGNQVFYEVDIPQGAELIVTVTPTGSKARINVYGYIDFNGNNLPPIQSCLSCEAGYELYVGNPDLTKEGEPQSISFAQAVNDPFTALIVVSGARDVLEGDYDLTFELAPM